MSLQEYLSNLNCPEPQWGIWVNPDNVNDYIVAPCCSENRKYILIGSLDKLSFGFQSQHDAIKQYLEENQLLIYKGKKVKVNKKEILQAWSDGNLDADFAKFLEQNSLNIMQVWSECEAQEFVNNKIPEIEQALRGIYKK